MHKKEKQCKKYASHVNIPLHVKQLDMDIGNHQQDGLVGRKIERNNPITKVKMFILQDSKISKINKGHLMFNEIPHACIFLSFSTRHGHVFMCNAHCKETKKKPQVHTTWVHSGGLLSSYTSPFELWM